MKLLLVAEYINGMVRDNVNDLIGFAEKIGGKHVMFIVGSDFALPPYKGTLYLADADRHGEYNPAVHKQLLLNVIAKEQPDMVVFSHSSYGWDLAPRVAYSLKAAQVSEAVDYVDGTLVVPVCNGKLKMDVRVKTSITVVTIQAGAFRLGRPSTGSPQIERIESDPQGKIEFLGYEEAEKRDVDLSKSEIIVSAGRGIGKAKNVELVKGLAKALGGECGASRPVVDSQWMERYRQVGTTGQTVTPKLYIACGISGAIQHVAGMKHSAFVVAINTDREAPIGEIADVMVVADVNRFIPEFMERMMGDNPNREGPPC